MLHLRAKYLLKNALLKKHLKTKSFLDLPECGLNLENQKFQCLENCFRQNMSKWERLERGKE